MEGSDPENHDFIDDDFYADWNGLEESKVNLPVQATKNPPNGSQKKGGLLYEPSFREIYEAYSNSTICMSYPSTCVDPSRHLMSTCLENLIAFCQWAREASTAAWIRQKLEYNARYYYPLALHPTVVASTRWNLTLFQYPPIPRMIPVLPGTFELRCARRPSLPPTPAFDQGCVTV